MVRDVLETCSSFLKQTSLLHGNRRYKAESFEVEQSVSIIMKLFASKYKTHHTQILISVMT
jgi:hypothetical protein